LIEEKKPKKIKKRKKKIEKRYFNKYKNTSNSSEPKPLSGLLSLEKWRFWQNLINIKKKK
jgi:hypothetical protein